jgi:hypothetical protein
MVPTAAKFQFHMVARVDDTCRFEEEDLKPNPQFPYTLLVKMCRSKNVLEERDAPDQIVIGAMDRRYCMLLALGIYLEVWIQVDGPSSLKQEHLDAFKASTTLPSEQDSPETYPQYCPSSKSPPSGYRYLLLLCTGYRGQSAI